MSVLKIKNSQGNWIPIPTVKGEDGKGIANAVLNDDYTLTLTFTDGTSYTTPSIKGEVGATGPQGEQGPKGDQGQRGPQGQPGTNMEIHICSSSEYDSETRIPTIEDADSSTFYLVPTSDGSSPDLFTEWVYVNNNWEIFGNTKIDLSGYLTDVTIGGNSVVTDGVAKIPFASSSTYGVIKPANPLYTDGGYLMLTTANSTRVKEGTTDLYPVSPKRQHEATFYGLAKAAGADMASSDNPVGTYTDEAKVAIQKMLGIYEPPYVLLNDITLEEESNIDLSADANGTPYNLRNVCISIYYATNLANASDGYGRYRFADGNNRYVFTETGKYTTSTSVNFKWIFVNRQGNLTYALYTRQATTGNAGVPYIKSTYNGILNSSSGSVLLDLGNITRIYSPTNDVEPAGTRIQIYGQWAY